MDSDDPAAAFFSAHAPPPLVSLTPFSPSASPSPRRLSSHFAAPSRPLPAPRKQLAWISLQGRLVGADEATSARAIGGALSPEEAVAWELFSPLHRVLIVAVLAAAASQSNKNRQISQLQKSVQLRDQVLSSMQQKLDGLCEQLYNSKDQVLETGADPKSVEDHCWLCDQHKNLSNDFVADIGSKLSNGDDTFKCKTLPNIVAEQEERRMSDLSDWASSSITSGETQTNTPRIEHDILNLKKDCEEKDATIKKLSTVLYSSDIAGSKRISELEDVIRRKNQMITKLKKDMAVLEQKVVHLTRLRRPSFSATTLDTKELPFMANNVIYDMDSTTSPSSSDSDSGSKTRAQKSSVAKTQETPVQNSELLYKENHNSVPQTPEAKVDTRNGERTSSTRNLKSGPAKVSDLVKSYERHTASRSASPLKEKSMNQRSDTSLKPKLSLSDCGGLRAKQRAQSRSKDSVPSKKWI